MKKVKITKETIALVLITILSAVLNLGNLSIEGTGNSYYAAAVKSMTMSFKNFFFVSFDPAGFVTIDKPPVGFWLQAISAKIFGYSGWSIILPQAIAGILSVIVIYKVVKRSFGSLAGLLSALFLAVTPVFVAASRNNTIDNDLLLVLLLACWALSIAAEKGKFKYLLLSMVLVGLGFNIKMLQAYMIAPALYITYLLATTTSVKKRILNLVISTVVLVAVSLSWALTVDSIPAKYRPYVDSSTNNTVMELIVGHNGIERLSLSSGDSKNGGGAPGGNGEMQAPSGNPPSDGNGVMGNPPSGNGHMGGGPMGGGMQGPGGSGSSNLQGSFGGQTTSSITRLFSKNILADQIVWFIPLAIFGFIAAAIKEKLSFKLDNKRKQSLVLWFMWFLPAFVYFSFNTGTFHPYYLTMLAPPTAALAAIGITAMWELYKEGDWKSWLLPATLMVNGAVHLLMLSYFISSSNIVKVLMGLVAILCFGGSAVLAMLNVSNKKEQEAKSANASLKVKKGLVAMALAGLLITPLVGSAAVLSTKLNGSFPSAGLELLSSSDSQAPNMGNVQGSNSEMPQMNSGSNQGGQMGGQMDAQGGSNSKLIEFLQKNKTKNQKYLLVVSNSNSASDIIINTGESVMSLGGFLGSDKTITLDNFKTLVNNGEVRYVMTGGQGGGQGGSGSSSEIMNWVKQNGTVVSSSEYSDSNATINDSNITNSTNTTANSSSTTTNSSDNTSDSQRRGFGGGESGQLYDLKAYTDSVSSK